MKEELIKIISELKEAIGEELVVDDNIIFEQAVKILLSNQIQGYKERNIAKVSEQKKTQQKPSNKENPPISEPATDKQKYALKQLGIEFDEGITKQEAFGLIKEAKERY